MGAGDGSEVGVEVGSGVGSEVGFEVGTGVGSEWAGESVSAAHSTSWGPVWVMK